MSRQSATTVLLEYTQDKIAVVDDEGTFTYVNEAALQILGFRPATLCGTSAWKYIHPDDRERVQDSFERVISETGFSETTETYRHRTADDSWVWLESRLSNLTDDAFDGYVVSSREITGRIEAQRNQRQSENRLREISEHTSDVLWLFNADWTDLLFCNAKCEIIYGISASELEGDPTKFLECIHPEDVPPVKEAMERLSAGEAVDMEYRVNPDVDYRNWVWVQGEPVVEDGEVVRIVGFARDVTGRRRRERQLAVMDNLLRHNLRNDMNVILANAELIEGHPDSHPEDRAAVIRRVGEQLVETAEKQRKIIDLLESPACPQTVPLSAAVADGVSTLTKRYPEATVHTDLQEVSARALDQMYLVVLELLENALRHADEPAPTAQVAVRADGDVAEIVISDNCPPIPEHEYRVLTGEHEMTATYHSSGLGLWLVYWIVDLSNGEIEFTRTADGNVATIRLPRVTDD